MNWDSKQRAYSCFPIELDWVLVFTVAVQPNLRAVKCQHALATYVRNNETGTDKSGAKERNGVKR